MIGKIIVVIILLSMISSAFSGGHSAGSAVYDEKYENWEEENVVDVTHTVTIYWNEEGTQKSEITVREDVPWDINGVRKVYSNDRMYSLNSGAVGTSVGNRNGKEFRGLYEAVYNGVGIGIQYMNAAGYATRTITKDVVVYAAWA